MLFRSTTALSTAEAEYMALASATQEALWLRSLITELGLPVPTPLKLKEDNQACIHLAHDPVHPKRTKHIDIRYHFIRDHVHKGHVSIEYVPTKDNLADLLTKALPKHSFTSLNDRILQIDVPFSLSRS